MIKASLEALARGGKERREGKRREEEFPWCLGIRCFKMILERKLSISLYNSINLFGS